MPCKYRRGLLSIVFAAVLIPMLINTGCQTVKPYQRVYLNDENMQTGKQAIEKFAGNMHTYREAASGGARGKASGGCGCN